MPTRSSSPVLPHPRAFATGGAVDTIGGARAADASRIDFEALFAGSPNPYVVLDRALNIVWMNRAYLHSTMRERQDILGRSMFEAFPSDPDSESHHLLKASLLRALEQGETDELALIRYDIQAPDGTMDMRYWSATHTPVMAGGEVAFVLQHTVDVTELHLLRGLRDGVGLVQRANALQARNRDLAEESERLRSLLERAPGFVAIVSGRDQVFRMANEAYRRLVGGRELVGMTVASALPEVVDQGFVELLAKVHDTGEAHEAKRSKVFLQNGPGDAEERYLDFIYQPIYTDDGQVSGVFVQGHDVTDQVAAEEHQKLLIDELNHRVKNTLAIVQGLASQSFRKSGELDEIRQAFLARLGALATAHDLLTRSNWEDASLHAIVDAECSAVAGVDRSRVRLSGPEIALVPQSATAVAMIVHELATNAVKYGSLSVPSGVVDIAWRIDRADGQRRLVLDWAESGGPVVSAPKRRGFGTRLIERGIGSDRLSGVTMDFRPEGLACRIAAALPAERR